MSLKFDKISIVGLGYIGLPTAAIMAAKSVQVIGVDINSEIVDIINSGKIHIVEPELDEIVHRAVKSGYLRAVVQPESADAFLITVPTPFKENHLPDISFVEAAAASIARLLKKGDLIILESTSPVGTTEKISKQLAALRPDLVFPHDKNSSPDIHIAYCPERVMPGQILRELIHNDRIIGGITDVCGEKAKALYQLFVTGNCITTDAKTAELTKLTENAFRDVNIAFANELSMICDQLDINVWELIKLANHHPRVNILQPGAGVGGHCIAVDPWFIVDAAPYYAKLIKTAREVNDFKPQYVLNKIRLAAASFVNPTIACLGMSYKANTDDLRESPAVEIIRQLFAVTDYSLLLVEPHINELPKDMRKNKKCQLVSLEKALQLADIVVLLVNHQEFLGLSEKLPATTIVINVVNEQLFKGKITSLFQPI